LGFSLGGFVSPVIFQHHAAFVQQALAFFQQ
jgi:hypothetical protein